MTRSRSVTIGLFAVLALGAVACSGNGEEATITTVTTTTVTPTTTSSTSTTAPTSTAASTTTTTIAPDGPRQPLTGEPLESEDDVIDRPALAVKIDNHPSARRNHTGLAVADIVYEAKVEGSLTRFAAVLHSQDADPLGPIRSGREQDVAVLSSLREPLFAWSGGNPGVTRLIRASFLVDIGAPSNSGAYYRGPGAGPHNLYSDTESLWALTPEDHPGPPGLQFDYLDDGTVFEGDVAKEVALTIGSIDIEWEWNADERRYERSQEGDKHVDKTYGQIGAENVVVLSVDYRQSSIDRTAPEAITLGSGVVNVISNGEMVTGTWERDLEIYPFRLIADDGSPIELTPGQTWVELAEVDSPGEAADIVVG